MDSVKDTFIKSSLAGFMIGIGGTVYLSLDNTIVGSLLFSFGLITIVTQQLYLYTGRIGYIKTYKDIPKQMIIILGNFIGAFVMSLMISKTELITKSEIICRQKILMSYSDIFIKSVLCGVIMYLAVDGFQKNKNIILLMMPVMIFIISGYEHSIANMFYFSLSRVWNLQSVIYLLLTIIGNGIGAIVFRSIIDKSR